VTLKDDKLVKKAQTMTAGVTATKLEDGKDIDLHGHTAHVTHTDAEITTVQYANKARRTFDTHVLNSFLELGTFPVGTEFERPAGYGMERAVIVAVTGNCCYQVDITFDTDETDEETFTYAELVRWHMGDMKDVKAAPVAPESEAKSAEPEALQFGEAVIKDLRAKLDKSNEELHAQSIAHDTEKNTLQREILELKGLIQKQKENHATIIEGYEQDIQRLEAKAAIINPAASCKEFRIVYQANEATLEKLSLEGWQIQHVQFIGEAGDSQLNVVFVRDIPASPAPKVVATDAAIYSQPGAGRPPVTQPPYVNTPLPANMAVVGLNSQPAGRMLTNNGPKPGETKKIPALADLELQKQRHADELNDIFSRGQKRQESLRREFANQPNPFVSGG
jgi:hypothetical protein